MNKKIRAAFFALSFFVCMTTLPAEMSLRIRGESLTPDGGRISLEWQVQKQNDGYLFYLNHKQKAEMVIADGKVVKIRRLVRFAGKDKWITFNNPVQIRLQLKSGFYPFAAVLSYQKARMMKTVMPTGSFTIESSAVK